MGTIFRFPDTDGMVRVQPGDYINIQSRVEATINTQNQDNT
ncbi:MAG: hypothetical protein U5R06_08195 [candidate division KSB1 bacterium]|nr:hypothetical protein [candidate division KSB1 bacterium]